jgi:hypothetical protein
MPVFPPTMHSILRPGLDTAEAVRYRAGCNSMTDAPEPEAPVAPIHRIQENLIARLERRALNHLCAVMPAWVTPDLLTFTGIVGALLVFGGYLGSNFDAGWLWLSIGGYLSTGSAIRSMAVWRGSVRSSDRATAISSTIAATALPPCWW